MFKELVKERLMAAADEIFALFEGTIASYEEELSRTKERNELQRQQLDAVRKTQTVTQLKDIQPLIVCQDGRPSELQKQKDPQPLHIKEEEEQEEEDLWIIRLPAPEEDNLAKLPQAGVSMKYEDRDHIPLQSSPLRRRPGKENKRAESPRSSSPKHATTEDDGDDCGGSQADNLLAPLSDSDSTISHSDKGRYDTQKPLCSGTDCESDMRTPTDNLQSEHSEKKTHSITGNIHKRTHTVEKAFVCPFCDKRFSQQSTMLNHIRTHTGEKPFSCFVCAKRFSQKCTMLNHMRTHTGEKPFVCSFCGERFTQKTYLVSHRRTHTGEKPFSCSACGKIFSYKSNMVKHMRTHTGEKPFSCSVCEKPFSDKSNMLKHMRKHKTMAF
ncbi:zinc finger protein 79-like [Nerophis ophidion]|uniref:zinc finger protein 79-like n=1 Tax=Nerophis ophidion TaxID=159077 RepID=UPI002AE00787|nr:zinc finger protein 79-like [Nerophis ophidion]